MQSSIWTYQKNNKMYISNNFVEEYEKDLNNNNSYDMLQFLIDNMHDIANYDYSTLDNIIRILITHNNLNTCMYFLQKCFTNQICTYNTIYKTKNIYTWKSEKCDIHKYITLNIQQLTNDISNNPNISETDRSNFKLFLCSFN